MDLIEPNLMPPASRRVRAPLHPGRPEGDRQRRLLLAYIQAHPGVHIRLAANVLGLTWNSCWHHVHRLEGQGLVLVRRHNGRLCLFGRAAGAVAPRLAGLLVRDPRNAALVERVLARPGVNQMALATSLGLAASVVHRRVVRLEAAGLLQRVRQARETLVHPTEALRHLWEQEPHMRGAALVPSEPLAPGGPQPLSELAAAAAADAGQDAPEAGPHSLAPAPAPSWGAPGGYRDPMAWLIPEVDASA